MIPEQTSGKLFQPPDRCDVIHVQFNPQAGKEMWDHHFAVVLSPKSYNKKTSLAVVCPITSKTKGNPFEVEIPSGYPVSGVILSDQIKSIDWRARGEYFKCKFSPALVDHVAGLACTLIEDTI